MKKHWKMISSILIVLSVFLGGMCRASLQTDPLSFDVHSSAISSSSQLIRTVNQDDCTETLSHNEKGVCNHQMRCVQQKQRNLCTASHLISVSEIPFATNIKEYVLTVTAKQCCTRMVCYIHQTDGKKG